MKTEELAISERYSRQRDLVPADHLAACRITIVGVGAIGRQVALQCAAMGARWLQLVDFDMVEPSNLASQGYHQVDLGRLKVAATADLCRQIQGELQIQLVPHRFRRSLLVGDVVFCCVDSIEARRLIWDALQHAVQFFVDGRMSAEVLRVLAVSDEQSRRHYPSTLFDSQEAYAGSCTAKTTIYAANIAAGWMVGQFAKWLRGLPVEPDVSVNLLTCEVAIGKEDS